MPPVGLFHTFYWSGTDTSVVPVLQRTGYPMWQFSVITSSLFGVIGAWCETRWRQLVWYWRLVRRVGRLRPAQRAVLTRALDALESPTYPAARRAIRTTATTLGFNRPEAWKALSRIQKADQGRAENMFRHLKACALTREYASSTLTNPACNLVVELAYQEYSIRPWRET